MWLKVVEEAHIAQSKTLATRRTRSSSRQGWIGRFRDGARRWAESRDVILAVVFLALFSFLLARSCAAQNPSHSPPFSQQGLHVFHPSHVNFKLCSDTVSRDKAQAKPRCSVGGERQRRERFVELQHSPPWRKASGAFHFPLARSGAARERLGDSASFGLPLTVERVNERGRL